MSQGIQGEVQTHSLSMHHVHMYLLWSGVSVSIRLSLNYHVYMHAELTDGTQPSGPDPKEEVMKKEIETEKAK